jgi:hypothetical protein
MAASVVAGCALPIDDGRDIDEAVDGERAIEIVEGDAECGGGGLESAPESGGGCAVIGMKFVGGRTVDHIGAK